MEWWESDPTERYWCEITDRDDIGANLWAPKLNESGKPYWSYSLVRQVPPGDIVFHYSTVENAIVGASVAGGPVGDRPIYWAPHGTVGRSKEERPDEAKPGWSLPLYGFTQTKPPLTLKQLDAETGWIRELKQQIEKRGKARLPVQLYPGGLRANQAYLTKLPKAFVDHWRALSAVVEKLSAAQEELNPLGEVFPAVTAPVDDKAGTFNPKSSDDYVAFIQGGAVRRTRTHEKLVRVVGEILSHAGGKVTNPHPIDLFLESPIPVLFEAKITRGLDPLFAIRQAIGQLLAYRFFLRPSCVHLGIILDQAPGPALKKFTEYLEGTLQLFVIWPAQGTLDSWPKDGGLLGDRIAVQALGQLGVRQIS
jgi:hypothetical protein